ncbi:hypothetical protein C1X23_27190, partial [Pseudomonas sp. FW300-E2]
PLAGAMVIYRNVGEQLQAAKTAAQTNASAESAKRLVFPIMMPPQSKSENSSVQRHTCVGIESPGGRNT